MKHLHVIFRGYVQGVGFRYTTERISRKFCVTGYVRNLMDGSVELAAEGEEKELQAFLQAIRTSDLGQNILELEPTWKEAVGAWHNFVIKH